MTGPVDLYTARSEFVRHCTDICQARGHRGHQRRIWQRLVQDTRAGRDRRPARRCQGHPARRLRGYHLRMQTHRPPDRGTGSHRQAHAQREACGLRVGDQRQVLALRVVSARRRQAAKGERVTKEQAVREELQYGEEAGMLSDLARMAPGVTVARCQEIVAGAEFTEPV